MLAYTADSATNLLPNEEMKAHYLGAHTISRKHVSADRTNGRAPERHCGWSFSDNRSALWERR